MHACISRQLPTMVRIEQGISSDQQGDLLRGRELYKREKEAWQIVLGVEAVPVEPLPKFVTSEVQRNLVYMGFGLRYVPPLDLVTTEYIRGRGIDAYLVGLQQEYPKWKPLKKLSPSELRDYTVSRNLQEEYWRCIKDDMIDFPKLPGQWMAVETVYKPPSDKEYKKTP